MVRSCCRRGISGRSDNLARTHQERHASPLSVPRRTGMRLRGTCHPSEPAAVTKILAACDQEPRDQACRSVCCLIGPTRDLRHYSVGFLLRGLQRQRRINHASPVCDRQSARSRLWWRDSLDMLDKASPPRYKSLEKAASRARGTARCGGIRPCSFRESSSHRRAKT